MGWRRNIVAAFESQVDANAVFAFESCSGALASARTRLRAAEARYGAGDAPSSSDDSSDSADDDPAGFRRRARAATRAAKGVIAKAVLARRAVELADHASTGLFGRWRRHAGG